jgi:predicted hydrolase (HD superfamily)
MGVPRQTPMEKTLFAVDELSGFVLACAYVRPQRLDGMSPKSVRKKLRQPSFAAAVDREDLTQGAADLGVDFDEHLTIVIGALAEREDELMGGETGSAPGDGQVATSRPPEAPGARDQPR